MKKFVLKGLLFCTIIFFVSAGIVILSTKEPTRSVLARWTDSEEFMSGSGMLPYFERAGQRDGTNCLVIGDSICRQMFAGVSEYNPGTSILATNAALMITGQYLLAEEYLQNHPDTTDIYLVMHPLTIIRTFDTEAGYRYATMTYVETDTLQYLDRNTIDTMTEVYGDVFMQKEVIRLIEESPIIRKLCLSYLNFEKEGYVQNSSFEIADQYIKKLYELCEANGVQLHFCSSPVAEYYREQMAELSEEYKGTWMSNQYPDYMNDIWYYPSDWTEDMSHFSGEYAERDRLNEIIVQAYQGTELLEKLRLE